jgi:CRP/FNR family transcriptional regulator
MTSPESVKPLLARIAIFAELDDAVISQLADRCVVRTFGAGRLLFAAGDDCRGLYIIESGRVRIYRTNPDGKEQVLHIEEAGRPVAELPLFDGGAYPASAITIEPTRLVFLAREDLESMYSTHPDVARAIIRALGKRLRHLVQVAETLAFHDVAARLAMLIADYAERTGTRTANGIELRLNRTQEELSIEIGTARESVSRALRELKRGGLIESISRNHIRVPDISRLRARARGR